MRGIVLEMHNDGAAGKNTSRHWQGRPDICTAIVVVAGTIAPGDDNVPVPQIAKHIGYTIGKGTERESFKSFLDLAT